MNISRLGHWPLNTVGRVHLLRQSQFDTTPTTRKDLTFLCEHKRNFMTTQHSRSCPPSWYAQVSGKKQTNKKGNEKEEN